MLRPISPLVEYVLNQDYIAEFLYINKNKPELECNGKCHLAKELENAQDDRQKNFRINLEEYPISPLNSIKINYFKESFNHLEFKLNSRYDNQ